MQQLSTFATNVRQELKKQKKNISWLSRESGISQCMISYYLSGKTEPSLSKASQISSVLNVPISHLIGENIFQPKELYALIKDDERIKDELLKDCPNEKILLELKNRLLRNSHKDVGQLHKILNTKISNK